jgi:hypothetical protein
MDHLSSRVLFSDADVDALNASLSVRGKAEIRNSFNSVRLTVFARSISFAFIRHSADHDICFFLWQAALGCKTARVDPAR